MADSSPAPTALQFVEYDSRTDVIQPRGKIYNGRGSVRAVLGHEGYEVRKPVVGWGAMTHLIQPGSGGWALATIPEAEKTCSACGEAQSQADIFCVMSRDGEGPHKWEIAERLTVDDLRGLEGLSGYEADPGDC